MEHKGGEHSVEGSVRIWKIIRKPLIELDSNRRSFRLASCSGERLRIRVESDDIDIRMMALDQCDQGASATADIKNAMPWLNSRLVEKRLSGPIAAEQLHEWVVERKRPVVACRRDISSSRFFHGSNSSETLSKSATYSRRTRPTIDMLRSVVGYRVKPKNLFSKGKMICLIEWTCDEESRERARQPTTSPTPRQSKPHAPDAPRSSVQRHPGTAFANIAFEKSNNETNFHKRNRGYEH